MRKSALIVLGTSVLLSACGGGGLFNRQRPDEFAVQRQAPLVVPPDCGKLRCGNEARAWREGELLLEAAPAGATLVMLDRRGKVLDSEAFAARLGGWRDTSVVVFSEFGRTFKENGNRGTDHGHGGVMWVLGGEH